VVELDLRWKWLVLAARGISVVTIPCIKGWDGVHAALDEGTLLFMPPRCREFGGAGGPAASDARRT